MRNDLWVDAMSIGVAEIDASHQALFALLSQIDEALGQMDFAEAERLCRSMLGVAAQHAKAEERLLRSLDYPDLPNIIEVQRAVTAKAERLLWLVRAHTDEARGAASEMSDELVLCLLRGDIGIKSFVQEMRDRGRLK
jgi:hemerythrin-like metal-binding protein